MIKDFISCDICYSQFNQTLYRPILLPQCGHTICQQCQNKCSRNNPQKCLVADCSTQYNNSSLNQKVLKYIRKMKSDRNQISTGFQGNLTSSNMFSAQSSSQQNLVYNTQEAKSRPIVNFSDQNFNPHQSSHSSTSSSPNPASNTSGAVACAKHLDKLIEYFCKQCNFVVCPKCMFDDHNGHQLAQLQDVTSIVRKNVSDLNQLLQNVDRVNIEHEAYLNSLIDEVKRMKGIQRHNIQNGFNELIKKLTIRRQELVNDFSKKYQQEEIRISKKHELITKNKSDIQTVRGIYNEIVKYLEKNSDAAILSKLGDITNFVTKSVQDLELISKTKGFDKNQVYIQASLRPLSMHVQKAFQIISKFTLVPSGKSSKQNILPNKTSGAGPQSGDSLSSKKKALQQQQEHQI